MNHERAEPSPAKETQPTPEAAGDKMPSAGPHAKPELTDDERTPGAGALTDTHETDVGEGASS